MTPSGDDVWDRYLISIIASVNWLTVLDLCSNEPRSNGNSSRAKYLSATSLNSRCFEDTNYDSAGSENLTSGSSWLDYATVRDRVFLESMYYFLKNCDMLVPAEIENPDYLDRTSLSTANLLSPALVTSLSS